MRSWSCKVTQHRSMSVPILSDIDFKNEIAWVWTTLKYSLNHALLPVSIGSLCCSVTRAPPFTWFRKNAVFSYENGRIQAISGGWIPCLRYSWPYSLCRRMFRWESILDPLVNKSRQIYCFYYSYNDAFQWLITTRSIERYRHARRCLGIFPYWGIFDFNPRSSLKRFRYCELRS